MSSATWSQSLRNRTPLSVGGPLWLLQLWLNSIFEKFMEVDGIWLSALKPTFPGPKVGDLFWAFFTKFYHATSFQNEDLNFAPFVDCKCGPTWFQASRISKTNEKVRCIAGKNWSNYTTIQVFTTGIPMYKEDQYQVPLLAPHFVARQMGFS